MPHRPALLMAAVLLAALAANYGPARVGYGDVRSARPSLLAEGEPVDRRTSGTLLQTLPDGETKRAFILDCTGCHTFSESVAYPAGQRRSRAGWHDAVARMLSFAGDRSGFPVISPDRDPDATAAWLDAHLPPQAPAAHRTASLPTGWQVEEFDYPVAQDLPHDLAVDGDGRVIVTGMFTHRMWLLDPATRAYDEVAIPVANANPRALEIGPDGSWWVVLGGPGMIARYEPDRAHWSTWNVGTYAHEARVAPDGGVWFNAHFSRDPVRLFRLDPATSRVDTLAVPTSAALSALGPIPYGLAVSPDGSVWGSDLRGNRIYRRASDGTVRSWTMPTTMSGPRRIEAASDGALWIPEYANNRITRFDPATERFESYELPVADALPYVVRLDEARNRLWVGTGAADALFVFDLTTERFTTVPLPATGALVRHLALDAATGDVWAPYGASPGIPARLVRVRAPE